VGRVVRVLPDEPAIAKTFDYLVPESLGGQVRVGTRVRIALGGRRVGGWIVAVDVSPPPGVTPRPLAKLSGYGPPADLIDLAGWAAWRWAGRVASFLRTANPDRVVTALPRPAPHAPPLAGPLDPLVADALGLPPTPPPDTPSPAQAGPAAGVAGPWFEEGEAISVEGNVGGPGGGEGDDHGGALRSVVRMAPADDPYPVVRAAAGLGNALVICPTVALARSVGMRLRRDGVGVAFHPRDWAAGAAGATVVGTRAAAWAPVADLAAVVVLDEHDESHAQEQAPTWHARDVVAERARRAGVPCVLVSPCPSLEALSWGQDRLLAPSRHDERAGWPVVDVVDRRQDDPRTGLLSPRLVDLLRSGRRVVCVLNRTGRARLLACAACGELARCEACDAALAQAGDDGILACPRCGTTRPVVCGACGATRLKLLRQGVSRVREELEALVGEPVDEVSSSKDAEQRPSSRVVVGTEAVLHQVDRVDAVAFLDLDQELLAPRYRAVDQALALLARAARLVGGKAGGGRLLLQTRVPRHEVVQAVLHGDPARLAEAEAERRELLRFPPAWAMAEVSGPAATAYIEALRTVVADPTGGSVAAPSTRPPDLWSSVADREEMSPTSPEDPWSAAPWGAPAEVEPSNVDGGWLASAAPRGIEILGPADGRWLVRAPDHGTLCDVLARVPRPAGRLRLAVDPLRV
jgi:primosomal protein N' (replication factor Y)